MYCQWHLVLPALLPALAHTQVIICQALQGYPHYALQSTDVGRRSCPQRDRASSCIPSSHQNQSSAPDRKREKISLANRASKKQSTTHRPKPEKTKTKQDHGTQERPRCPRNLRHPKGKRQGQPRKQLAKEEEGTPKTKRENDS